MDSSNVIAITEAYRVYMLLDEECKSKIPSEFVMFLEENKNLEYGCQITKLLPLHMQEISDEGFNLITYMFSFIK